MEEVTQTSPKESGSWTSPQPAPRLFSIRVTARLTNISQHTLRIWEKRYGYPAPIRNDKGARFYTEQDITRLRCIQQALDLGHRPSRVVSLASEELQAILDAEKKHSAGHEATTNITPTPDFPRSDSIETLLDHLVADRIAHVQMALRQLAWTLGGKRFVTDIAAPLAREVGERWVRGELEVRHEHIVSQLLSTQLRICSSLLAEPTGRPHVVLATLPGEPHGLGLEMVAVYLASFGATSHLLGTNTPAEDIVKAARAYEADVIGLYVTEVSCREETTKHLLWILEVIPKKTRIWIGGANAMEIGIKDPCLTYIDNWKTLDTAIEAC